MLDKAAQDSTGDDGQAMKQAQNDINTGKLQAALDAANANLQQGHLLQATSQQKVAADELRKITKDLNPPGSLSEQLSDFLARLNKLVEEQKDVLIQTNAAAAIKTPMTGLDSKEGMIVYNTDSLQQDMQSTSPDAAGMVKAAIAPMQVARRNLSPNGGNFAQAAGSEQDAIDKLLAAEKALSQQLADAQKAEEEAAKDADQKLHDLQQKIQTAMKDQQNTTNQTAQADAATPPDANALAQDQQNQGALQQSAQAMQQDAAPLSLPASQALSNAAQAMSQAQQAMADPANAQTAAQAQQAAQQALSQANDAVNQAIAQTEQQAADPSQLQNAANDLDKAQAEAGEAQADAQNGAPQGGQDPTMAQAEQALQQAQQDANAASQTPGLPDAAQQAIGDADKEIGQGEDTAKAGDAKGTAGHAAAAQAALAQAQAAVAVAMAGMSPNGKSPDGQSPNGQPMPGPPSMARTAPHHSDQKSMYGAKTALGGGDVQKGNLHGVSGNGAAAIFQKRDREAITETEAEAAPQEYSPMISQYMKNLSDQSSSSPSE
jgi:hypothetical protein